MPKRVKPVNPEDVSQFIYSKSDWNSKTSWNSIEETTSTT